MVTNRSNRTAKGQLSVVSKIGRHSDPGAAGGGGGTPTPPTSTYYVAEDGATFYVAEDGTTNYITENSV